MDSIKESISNCGYILSYFQSGNINVGRNGRTLGPSWQVGAEVRAQSRRAQSEAWRGAGDRRG